MPFVTKRLHSSTRQKAFLFLMKELGISQSEAQRLIAKGRLSQNGEVMANNAGYIEEGEFDFICVEKHTLRHQPTSNEV